MSAKNIIKLMVAISAAVFDIFPALYFYIC